ncbi:hypothetical protein DY000_02039193 [Brassica cretica]|uniref:Ubiquitin-like protease family profile domain-containing protein n=1 Tax=Brassica cretica TaxID=69181 RepID=A0ABQ7BCE3_BRACR|nr:hypothetical protein DY000_02039193 [Brassica cretica]
MKFTDASLVPYINAYAMALPFMIRNFFKDVSMDTSMFSIKIVSEVEEKYWVGIVVNLEKRRITSFNCAAMKFTYASLVPYINAYAMALPFMIRNFFKDVSMDTSMFSIKIVSEGFPQVPKIEDIGVYALKLIKCHAMRIVDLTKLSEEKIAIIRENDLVEDVDSEFGRVVDLVKRGYRLKRQDWFNGSVDITVAEAEVDENNSAPGIDATDQEKIEFLTKKVVSLEKKMKYLEGFLNIRGEILKVNGQNADYEVGDTEVLQNYIDAKRQEITKGKKKGIRPPGEVDHQVEDDTEVEHGAKESDTTKVNEGQTQEEEEHQVEDDADVYDGELNEDASKKPVKVTKKRGRGNKGKKKSVKPPREVQQQVEDDAEIGAKESENPKTNEDGEVNEDASKKSVKFTKKRERGNKGMKKGVTPPREVQQQVEDDAEVDAKESENPETNCDGEVNEDASKKPVKFTKKLEEEIR